MLAFTQGLLQPCVNNSRLLFPSRSAILSVREHCRCLLLHGIFLYQHKGEEAKTSTQDTPKELCLLLSVDDGSFDAESSLMELRRLAETAGAEVFALIEQKRESPDAATYIGSGRLEEVRELCAREEIDLLIVDGELTPTQQRNLENAVDRRVIDRTTLILDIFAKSAKTNEGKIQVELAQLQYLLPRLAGRGTALSRLGGGIGTRGPGETKLETDRRHIRRRIHTLEEALKKTEKQRYLRRSRRQKNGILTCAIVSAIPMRGNQRCSTH